MSGDANLSVFLKADWAFTGIFIVEYDCYARFCDAGLASFIDQILQVLSSDGAHICDSEDETYSIKDI